MTVYFSGYVGTDAEWLDRSIVLTTRPWWPRRCTVTNKWLWIRPAVRVRRIITGPGDPVVIDHWVESRAYTIQTLKGWK